MYRKSSNNMIKHGDFLLLDLVLLLFSLGTSYLLRNGRINFFEIPLYRDTAIVLSLVHILTAFFTESYLNILRRGYWKEFLAVLKHCTYMTIFLLVYLFVTQNGTAFSRIVLLFFPFAALLFLYLGRMLLKALRRKTKKHWGEERSLLLVTSGNLIERIFRQIAEGAYAPYRTIGIACLDTDIHRQKLDGIQVLEGKKEILDYIKCHWVDEVLVDLSDGMKVPEELIDGCAKMGVTVHLDLSAFYIGGLEKHSVGNVAGHTVLTCSMASASLKELFFKRLIDICGAAMGLAVTALLFIVFAPIIYLQSPGPIFFSQERIGKNGRAFRIYKFRSMHMDAEKRKKELMAQNKMNGLMFKIDNDPRIIPIGRFMRAASLDEFPQFWNILKGDMSLVGTRPPTVDEYEQYELHHKARLAAKPGLTGMWQVSGRSDITDFEQVVALDTRYIQDWSIGLDIKILLKTVLVVLRREGSV